MPMTPAEAFGELIDGLVHLFRRDHWQELIRPGLPALTAAQQDVAYGVEVQLVLRIRVVLAKLQRDVLAGDAGA